MSTETHTCTQCGVAGVKLWRAAMSLSPLWCAQCGTAQAGLENTVDAAGCIQGKYGPTDQIYNPERGVNLLPFCPVGDTAWGYTSVPPEDVAAWKALPTAPEETP